MKIINFSKELVLGITNANENLNLIYQFFIHKNIKRNEEIKKCLEFNVKNKFITKIYLLNERIYTNNELGIESDKIIQHDIKKRLRFHDVFKFINDNNIIGYNIIINADIFFDETINNLNYSNLNINKTFMALLRYEYDTQDITRSILSGPRFDSQDTWIIHSNFKIDKEKYKIFNFEFGKPGCDNKIVYLMNILGYEIMNDPYKIKTYHYHNVPIRDYNINDLIDKPWGIIVPCNTEIEKIYPSLGIDLNYISRYTYTFVLYLESKK
jgi:hypothetical protein